jgi:hypothetical protein
MKEGGTSKLLTCPLQPFDLYDWNHMVTSPPGNQEAAILQVGYGKGAYGSARNRGKVYRNRIEFNKIYTNLP